MFALLGSRVLLLAQNPQRAPPDSIVPRSNLRHCHSALVRPGSPMERAATASAGAAAAVTATVAPITETPVELQYHGCTRSALCTKPAKHVGACNKALAPGSHQSRQLRKRQSAELSGQCGALPLQEASPAAWPLVAQVPSDLHQAARHANDDGCHISSLIKLLKIAGATERQSCLRRQPGAACSRCAAATVKPRHDACWPGPSPCCHA